MSVMIISICVIVLIASFLLINWRVRRTQAYANFYRTIHIMKDVPVDRKFTYGSFGSTFSYYAFDLKAYNGHNFSIEPQSLIYMKKTVEHFIDNIEENGQIIIALAGCFFATESTITDEQCITYYSFLKPYEFNHYYQKVKIKYLLKRYFPALSPYYVRCIFRDEINKYGLNSGIGYGEAIENAKKRVKGWERVVGLPITEDFKINEQLLNVLQRNIVRMKELIDIIRANNINPLFVILPMSVAFNKICPDTFYQEILYRCLDALRDEKVPVLDYLCDEELCKLENFFTADCLNQRGRKLLSEKLVKDLNKL